LIRYRHQWNRVALADEVGAGLQGDAARGLGIFEILDQGEVPVDQHRVGQRTADVRLAVREPTPGR